MPKVNKIKDREKASLDIIKKFIKIINYQYDIYFRIRLY